MARSRMGTAEFASVPVVVGGDDVAGIVVITSPVRPRVAASCSRMGKAGHPPLRENGRDRPGRDVFELVGWRQPGHVLHAPAA